VGQATVIRDIEIWWPVSNTRQHFRNVPLDCAFHIREGREVLDPIHWKPFEIGKTKIAPAMMDHHH
jgi:hypothetical protein